MAAHHHHTTADEPAAIQVPSEEPPPAPATPDDASLQLQAVPGAVSEVAAAGQPASAGDDDAGAERTDEAPARNLAPALAASRRLLSKNSRVSFKEPAKEAAREAGLDVPPSVPEEEEAAEEEPAVELVEPADGLAVE